MSTVKQESLQNILQLFTQLVDHYTTAATAEYWSSGK